MSALLAILPLAQEKSIAEEGRDIILVMLGVGLIFLGVIAIGQFSRWLVGRRRQARMRRARL